MLPMQSIPTRLIKQGKFTIYLHLSSLVIIVFFIRIYIRWATFEVSTNENYSDSVQVRAAGFLEGYLSHELIYLNYLNTLDGFCIGNEILCENLNNYLETNTEWAKEMYTASRNADPFWHQVLLLFS